MTTADRRLEIVSVLVVNGHVTSRELAQEFGVARRTILNDVAALTYGYPIYTKPGAGGGFSSWRVTGRTTIRSLPTNRRNSKKCMMRQRGRIRKY